MSSKTRGASLRLSGVLGILRSRSRRTLACSGVATSLLICACDNDTGGTAADAAVRDVTLKPDPGDASTPPVGHNDAASEEPEAVQPEPDSSDAAAPEPVCGNGEIEGEEECDDGDDTDDGCRDCLRVPVCGDGVRDGREQCDDGNDESGDGCSRLCACEEGNPQCCGDGIVTGDEECDDGNDVTGDGCVACRVAGVCGDRIRDSGEECDDGNDDASDLCDHCQLTSRCGNGILGSTEECDDGNEDPLDGCFFCVCISEPCLGAAVCGDGLKRGSLEECDDGNAVSGDGCSADCRLECGDAILQPAEECDDGNQLAGDGCSPECLVEFCGDGSVVTADGYCPPLTACLQPKCTCPDRSAEDCCSESLPYRAVTFGDPWEGADDFPPAGEPEAPAVETYSSDEIWSQFSKGCGSGAGPNCHEGGYVPVFSFSLDTLCKPGTGGRALERILSPYPALRMPPETADNTPCNNPNHLLGRLLVAWEEQGCGDSVELEACETGSTDASDDGDMDLGDCGPAPHPYKVPEDLAEAQTNLGSCVPSVEGGIFEDACPESYLQAMDAIFANAETSEDLPLLLSETDLNSLDSEQLARGRVFSYAPTYTLFSDSAKKQRYVRVPSGESIVYDESTQDFDFPDNTRFYKTFLKSVVQSDGSVVYRKVETRLIVARRHQELADGSYKIRALRVTYAWDRDETEAYRVQDPLRNGEEWRDRICPYITDENITRDEDVNPVMPDVPRECTYMTDEELEDPESGAVRHYVIPSSPRCDECHMGAHNRSYIAGFSPWHVNSRPKGEGGVWEDIHEDQLSQFQRLLDYGVISGVEADDPRLLLENSQGDRLPRNEYELQAQAYMMSNCATCHNPIGFPVVQNPLLAPFSLYPENAETGGVFQFPLDLASPRAKIGNDLSLQLPYITPLIGNCFDPLSEQEAQPSDEGLADFVPQPKMQECALRGGETGISPKVTIMLNPDGTPNETDIEGFGNPAECELTPDCWVESDQVEDSNGNITTQYGSPMLQFYGPWRSLIWRNVYTPFTYADDGGIFIHMPRNVPAYDCNAPSIMANWMLSIPAVRGDKEGFAEEVAPGDPRYEAALADAERIRQNYQNSVTGQHCPAGSPQAKFHDDAIDPLVINHARFGLPDYTQPLDRAVFFSKRLSSEALAKMVASESVDRRAPYKDGVPDHAHLFAVDTTDAGGQWTPRRRDWKALLTQQADPRDGLSPGSPGSAEELAYNKAEALATVIEDLSSYFASTELEDFMLEPVPLGTWSERCREYAIAEAYPTVEQLAASSEAWADWTRGKLGEAPAGDSMVHYMSRGEAVFRAICINCHGSEYDSKSPLATTILEMTGGTTRVANFRDGLLGPVNAPGAFAEAEFTFAEGNTGGTPQDWQLRYMLFMGLGGTRALIPSSALSLVGASPFYGHTVTLANDGAAQDARTGNMLQAAQVMCRNVFSQSTLKWEDGKLTFGLGAHPVFVPQTGHFELWRSLCQRDNDPVIRILRLPTGETGFKPLYAAYGINAEDLDKNLDLFRSVDDNGLSLYPTDAPIGDQDGKVRMGLTPDNLMPWCIDPALKNDPAMDAGLANRFKQGVPYCPQQLLAAAFGDPKTEGTYLNRFDLSDGAYEPTQRYVSRWLRKGAMNAGAAAYYYLDRHSKQRIHNAPDFDSKQCQP